MVQPFRQHQSGSLPPKGGICTWFGNSIGAPFYYGQAWDLICAALGMVKAGGNLVAYGSFEADTLGAAPIGWVAPSGCTLVADNAHVFAGTKAGKVTATAATAWVAPQGDTGAIRLGFQAARAYSSHVVVWLPTTSHGTVQATFTDNINDGTSYQSNGGASISPANVWQGLTATRTFRNNLNLVQAPAGMTEAFTRIVWAGATVGDVLWLDNFELDTGATPMAFLADGFNASGVSIASSIAGSLLSNKGAPGGDPNGTDNFAIRVTGNPNLVIVEYGINDMFNANARGIGSADWRTAVRTCLANLKGLSSKPVIVWLGLPTTTAAVTLPVTGWAGFDVSTVAAFKYSMNRITMQECLDAGVPFVPLFPDHPASLVQANTPNNVTGPSYVAPGPADGVHPTNVYNSIVPGYDGQTYLANAVLRALGVS